MLYQILCGRRCWALLRCSTKRQEIESIPQQREWLKEFADEQKMTYVDDFEEARSASQTKKRPDIERLINRKLTHDDFDTVLVQDLSRLTRGGIEHGLKVYFRFKDLGVLIVSVIDGPIDSEEKLKQAIKRFEEARAAVKASTQVQVRGKIKRRKAGHSLYTMLVPYGLDKLILDANRKRLFILRDKLDGTQEQYDANNGVLLRTFTKVAPYRKQRDDFVSLVPGDPVYVEVLKRIFRRRFADQAAITMIARELNEARVPSPRGKKWSDAVLRVILGNSVYFGVGRANRCSVAEYYQCGMNTPEVIAEKDNESFLKAGSVKKNGERSMEEYYRPMENWFEQSFPDLRHLLQLEPEVEQRAIAWQTEESKRRSEGRIMRSAPDRYPESDFILKGLLRSKQGDQRMSGMRSGKVKRRYYRVNRGIATPGVEKSWSRVINANALETAILATVKGSLLAYVPDDSVIQSAILEVEGSRLQDKTDVTSLKREREALRESIEFFALDMIAVIGASGVREKTRVMREQVAELDRRISVAANNQIAKEPLNVTVKELKDRCASLASSWDGFDRMQIRNLLPSLVSRLEVDLETREVDLELRLPLWANFSDDKSWSEKSPLEKTFFCATDERSIPFAEFRCREIRVSKSPCFTCTRKPKPPLSDTSAVAA